MTNTYRLPSHLERLALNTADYQVKDGNAVLELVCPKCGKHYTVSFPLDGFRKWAQGERVQDALPDATPTEREYLLTSWCEKCQDEFFN